MSNQRRWFEKSKAFVATAKKAPEEPEEQTPDLWTRCPSCGETLYNLSLIHI